MANATIDEDPSSIRSKSLVSQSMSALPARTAFAQRPVDAVDVEMTEASSPPQKDVQDDVLIGEDSGIDFRARWIPHGIQRC